MKYSLKHVYIILLLVLISLLVFLVQGLYENESKYIKQVEFKRGDGFIEDIGNITEVLIKINNQDTVNHNYTFNVSINSVFFSKEIVEVWPGVPFSFKITVPVEKQITEKYIWGAVSNITFDVYRDDRSEPIDRIEYKYD